MFKPNPYTANLSFSTHIVCSDEQHQLILQQASNLDQTSTWSGLAEIHVRTWQIHLTTLTNPNNQCSNFGKSLKQLWQIFCKHQLGLQKHYWLTDWIVNEWQGKAIIGPGSRKLLHKKFYPVDLYLSSKITNHIHDFQFINKSKFTTDPAWHSQKLWAKWNMTAAWNA